MAKIALVLLLFSLGMAMQLVLCTNGEPKELDEWIQKLNHAKLKVSRLNFYHQDTHSGKNPSAVAVAEASTTNKSPTSFGLINIFDDPLTEGPEPTSKLVHGSSSRKAVFHPIREMPIVGGTGAFRLARGFVTAKTHVLNFTSGDAIIEYHVVAIHYWAPSL
uniref:Dirigent protein n=1 Tax=Quercus lobata TaxID=97700 RepID=A0A7N2N2D0_QUELO